MNKSKRQLLQFLTSESQQTILDNVLQEMRQSLGADAPSAPDLRAFFQSSDAPTSLTLHQQVLAVDAGARLTRWASKPYPPVPDWVKEAEAADDYKVFNTDNK